MVCLIVSDLEGETWLPSSRFPKPASPPRGGKVCIVPRGNLTQSLSSCKPEWPLGSWGAWAHAWSLPQLSLWALAATPGGDEGSVSLDGHQVELICIGGSALKHRSRHQCQHPHTHKGCQRPGISRVAWEYLER